MIGIGCGIGTVVGSSSPPPWSPPSGCVDWIKADDTSKILTCANSDGTSEDGSPVDGHYLKTWSDSAGGSIAWGIDSSNLPTWVATGGINGLSSAHFSGSQVLVTSQLSALSLTAGEVFIVTMADRAANGLWYIGTDGGQQWYAWSGDSTSVFEDWGSSSRPGSASFDVTAAHIYNVRSSSTEYTVAVDGTVSSTTGTNTVAWQSTSTLGSNTNSGYQGYVGEMLTFDSVLSSGDRSSVVTYLRDKWGTP